MNKILSDSELSTLANALSFKEIYGLTDQKENIKEIKDILQNIIYLKPETANIVSDELINKIGNNHTGVCFIEFDWVIEFLITVLKNSVSNRTRSICILSMLNDLCCFKIMEKYPHDNNLEEIKFNLKNKLEMYCDEYFEIEIKKFKARKKLHK